MNERVQNVIKIFDAIVDGDRDVFEDAQFTSKEIDELLMHGRAFYNNLNKQMRRDILDPVDQKMDKIIDLFPMEIKTLLKQEKSSYKKLDYIAEVIMKKNKKVTS